MATWQKLNFLKLPSVLAAFGLALAGCSTSDVNDSRAKANMGYVDFYDASSADLSWEISRFDDRTGKFQRMFVDWAPPQNGIVRLAFAPGGHRLRVTYLNRAVVKPADIRVEVEVGKITPVRTSMKKAGVTEVETAESSIGGTLYGTYGRRTKITSDEEPMYALTAIAAPPEAFQPKAKMPYAR